MMKSSRDIQLSELKDMIAQLNLTIKTLNDPIARQQSENDNPGSNRKLQKAVTYIKNREDFLMIWRMADAA